MKFLLFYLKVVKHVKQENAHIILAVYMIQNENLTVGDALRSLVPFVEFKKYKKHPWRSVTISKVAG